MSYFYGEDGEEKQGEKNKMLPKRDDVSVDGSTPQERAQNKDQGVPLNQQSDGRIHLPEVPRLGTGGT